MIDQNILKRAAIRAGIITLLVIGYLGFTEESQPKPLATTNSHVQSSHKLIGDRISPLMFDNPYAQIPAQCYIETAAGTQNACLFCHTNGVWAQGMGNNNPQAGAFADIGNFQREYSFAPYDNTSPLATINRWENTLFPEKLAAHIANLGIDVQAWDMQTYIRQDNWQTAYNQRPLKTTAWDSGTDSAFRFLPALNPSDLPAQADGFVRTHNSNNSFFNDGKGLNTGWRAVNFMPYGIFSPQTGSVSGIYLRLPAMFMQTETGQFDLALYEQNLELVAKAVQNRLTDSDSKTYLGAAKQINVIKGVYPVGTEFAHPLHYVDVDADGSDLSISRFTGTRSQRVKEVRYMIKWEDYNPNGHRPTAGAEPSSILGSDKQGWVDNGAGWYLVGFIEDKNGALRPQNREEMTQCIGCHSGVRETEFPTFTSGTGNTVDSTWSFPRQLPNGQGWQEMNYLGYVAGKGATIAEPVNRDQNTGEYRLFLEHVVGANLYGQMPDSIENALAQRIRTDKGYSANWSPIDQSSAAAYRDNQKLRQKLLREFTAKSDYKDAQGRIKAELFYPPKVDALLGASRYRQVVATQTYTKGKDVFAQTPHTLKALRPVNEQPKKLDGTSYMFNEVINERSIEQGNPSSSTYRAGDSLTEIDSELPFKQGGNYLPNYTPFLR